MDKKKFGSLFSDMPVIPVATLSSDDDAIRMAGLLRDNGIPMIEVTLRTSQAYNCISAIRREVPDMIVGAGSILSIDEVDRAIDAGAMFGVAPCLNEPVLNHSSDKGLPMVPGIATPSELARALEKTDIIKVFPIAQLGGAAYIKAISAPFRKISFSLIPTGGVSMENLRQYLDIDVVLACGMSQMVDPALIEKKDWSTLESRIREAVSLVKGRS